jgi:hypothetical protein
LTSLAHALTAFTDFWNSPGETAVLTSAIRPTLMVVAVSPTSLPAAAGPAGEAGALDADPAAAELEAAALPAVDPVDELLELQPAASRMAAASAPIAPRRRTRARTGRARRVPGLSL